MLSGGGAYAAYEIGILKALSTGQCSSTNYRPLNPGVLSGTSSGSLNAALLTSRADDDFADAVAYADNVWRNTLAGDTSGRHNGVFRLRLDPGGYFDPASATADPVRRIADTVSDGVSLTESFVRRGSNFVLSKASVQSRLIQLSDPSVLIDQSRLPETLRAIIDLDGIRRSPRRIRVAATNWRTGIAQIFTNQELGMPWGHEIIRASTAIPGLFSPVVIGGVAYVDGALVTNTPLKPAVAAGATELHVVYLDPDVRNIALSHMLNILQTFERALAIAFATITNADIADAASVNEGLAVLRNAGTTPNASRSVVSAVARTVSRISKRLSLPNAYRPLTIHRYHPRVDLGTAFGLLDFSRDRVGELIETGFRDALRHTCSTSGCIIPSEQA